MAVMEVMPSFAEKTDVQFCKEQMSKVMNIRFS
jgi:hypothetical protein